MVHICNLSYSGGRGRRIMVRGQRETLSENKLNQK
jgi:hypothetical protein